MIRWVVVISLGLISCTGCKSNPECERERVQLHKIWGSLRSAATKRKLAGVDVADWEMIENKCELLESAFQTPQVTWKSADKASQEVRTQLESIQTDDAMLLEGFRSSAEAAFKSQAGFTEKCR